ncbi:hypothetical protein LJ613_001174, partial [Acinetobacter baumannii]
LIFRMFTMALKQITKDEANLLNVLLGQVNLLEGQNGKPVENLTLIYDRKTPGLALVGLVYADETTTTEENGGTA